jgi:hypothetical protein
VSELEQSERISKATSGIASLTNILGATILGSVGFAVNDRYQYAMHGLGITFPAISVIENVIWKSKWPPKRQ